MKGQNALINEILLFILGILIASFVSFSMSNIEKKMVNVTTEDHMREISDYIVSGIVKAYGSGNSSSLVLPLGSRHGSQTYRLRLIGNSLVVSLVDDERISFTQEIFNISAGKTINGDITSSSKYVLIKINRTNLEIKKWQGNWT